MCTRITAGPGRVDGSYHVADSVTPSSVRNVTRWAAAVSVRRQQESCQHGDAAAFRLKPEAMRGAWTGSSAQVELCWL